MILMTSYECKWYILYLYEITIDMPEQGKKNKSKVVILGHLLSPAWQDMISPVWQKIHRNS